MTILAQNLQNLVATIRANFDPPHTVTFAFDARACRHAEEIYVTLPMSTVLVIGDPACARVLCALKFDETGKHESAKMRN